MAHEQARPVIGFNLVEKPNDPNIRVPFDLDPSYKHLRFHVRLLRCLQDEAGNVQETLEEFDKWKLFCISEVLFQDVSEWMCHSVLPTIELPDFVTQEMESETYRKLESIILEKSGNSRPLITTLVLFIYTYGSWEEEVEARVVAESAGQCVPCLLLATKETIQALKKVKNEGGGSEEVCSVCLEQTLGCQRSDHLHHHAMFPSIP